MVTRPPTAPLRGFSLSTSRESTKPLTTANKFYLVAVRNYSDFKALWSTRAGEEVRDGEDARDVEEARGGEDDRRRWSAQRG